ncbi:MAG: sensor domain-containing diguanylate cyclase [Acidimicrobiales bacterium]
MIAIYILRARHLLSDTPMWVLAVILLVGGVANFGGSLWLRARPDDAVRIHARVAVSVLSTAAVVYAVGWGSLLMVAFGVGTSELLRTIGPRATRANLVWNWVAVALGELAVHFQLAPSVVRPELAHAIAIAGAGCLGIVTKVLGDSARATELAEDLVRPRAIHFESLIEHASDLIGVISLDGTIVSVSPAVTPMLGYEPADVAGRPISMFIDDDLVEQVDDILRLSVEQVGRAHSFELNLRHRDGSDRLVVATLTTPSRDWSDQIVLNVHDVTTQRDLEEQLRHDARHDALTGLLNRKAFGESSERSCRRAARDGRTVGMLYIDLDGFKQINDTFGHDAGDRVLVEAANRLRGCLHDGETLARLGGDEFAVLMDTVDGESAVVLAERILDALGQPITELPDTARVGASIGIALRSSEGIEISTLMQDADSAMYSAKRNGRSRWEMTAPESAVGA